MSSLKVGSTNYASSMASGFFYREPVTSIPNLVSNGSFESGSGTPTGWTVSGGTSGTWSIDATTAYAGTRSMKLYVAGTTGTRSPDLTSSTFPLVPNIPYSVSYKFKSSNAGGSALTLYVLEQDQTGLWVQRQAASLPGTNAWTTKTVNFTSSPITSQAYIKFNISGGYGTVWVDDVRMEDPFGGRVPVALGGAVTSSGGVVTQTASQNGLNLVARFTNAGSAIRADVTLTNTTGSDRGVELSYRLPLDIVGWTWDDDLVTSRAIASGTRYEYLDKSFAGVIASRGHTHSIYPFSTVRNSSAAFSLAVPPGPLMERFTYDDTYGFILTCDVGLSTAATKSPSKAAFTFWIYTQNPKWGIRASAEKYYAMNSSSFTTSATELGGWEFSYTKPLSSVPSPKDFGWGYQEGSDELAFDNANGFVGLHYLSAPEWDINFSGYSSQPPYNTLVTALNNSLSSSGTTVDGTPTSQMAAAVIASSPYDENGLYQLSANPYFWYTSGPWEVQMYPVLPYSALAGGTYPLRTQYAIDLQIHNAQLDGNTLGGIFLDNTSGGFASLENYRKSLWAYNNGTLSFSYKTGKVIQYAADSMADFLGAFRSYAHSKNLVLLASIDPGSYVWLAPNVDVVGGEVPGAETLSRIYNRRTMSYGKILTTLLHPSYSGPTPDAATILAYLRQALLLGYFPGSTGLYWDDSTAYERDRPTWKLYIPLIKTVAQAGWKPVHYTTSSDPSILIERFGNPSSGTFYVTAQNPGTTTSSPQFTLDGTGLGISSTATVTARELVSNAAVAVTRSGSNLLFSDSLASGETALYRISVAASPPPSIGKVTPSTGPTGGGTSVSISGTNFRSGLTVSLGGASAAITSVTSTSISATTPFHAAGAVNVVVTNSDSQSSTLANGYTYTSSPPMATRFYTLPPCRVIDTRNPAAPRGGPALAAGSNRTFLLTGICGIPATARALAVNATVTQGGATGYLTAYPGGSATPPVSLINYSARQTRANNGILPLGSGSLSVHCAQPGGTVQFILDVSGYFE